MATALQILRGFGVKSITPTDPGIIKLAKIRTGSLLKNVPQIITPETQALQLLGKVPDLLAQQARTDPSPGILGISEKITPLIQGFFPGASYIPAVATKLSADQSNYSPPQNTRFPMSYYDPATGGFSDVPPISTGGPGGFSFSDLFGGVSGADVLSFGNNLLTAFGGYNLPGTQQGPSATPVMSTVPAIARGGMMVGRAFFNRFPNLATAIQRLRNVGQNVNRSKLYSLMKRFGPDFLITGGILSAAAVSELAVAGPGRRRMNSANIKALRRAHRRMASFHHICRKNDALMHRGGRRRPTAVGGVTRITQVK